MIEAELKRVKEGTVHDIGYVSRSREFTRRVTSGSMLKLLVTSIVLSVTILNSFMFTDETRLNFSILKVRDKRSPGIQWSLYLFVARIRG